MPDPEWTTAEEGSPQIVGGGGGPLKSSLFLPVHATDLNSEDRSVAVYLDDEAAIRWWRRNGASRDSYAVRGWRRGNVYPDFVFAALREDAGERIVALETKAINWRATWTPNTSAPCSTFSLRRGDGRKTPHRWVAGRSISRRRWCCSAI